MSFTAIYVMIFLIAFVLIGGVVMFLSKTIDHGEARFDSETGEPLRGKDSETSDTKHLPEALEEPR